MAWPLRKRFAIDLLSPLILFIYSPAVWLGVKREMNKRALKLPEL
jgi:hypothetical protein